LKRTGKTVYDVRLRDPGTGKEYSRTFERKRLAEQFERDERSKQDRGAWISPDRMATSFGDVADAWLASGTDKRGASIVRDRGVVERWLKPAFGARPVGSITPDDVQHTVNAWGQKRSPATVTRMYSVLRAVMNYAVTADLIVKSPCRRIRLPQAHPREARILDAAALAGLAAELGDHGPMVYLAVQGLRWGEIAGLEVRHLDLLRHTVRVEQQRTRGLSYGMELHAPKTRAGTRTISVPAWLSKLLADHLAARGVTGADQDAPVFVEAATGGPLRYTQWRRAVWLPAAARAGLVGFTFHDLKHTAGTALVSAGVDIKTAQARLGHASPITTLRVYAQATEQADRAAAEAIGDQLRPPGLSTVG